MKRLLSLTLALVMVLSLSACGQSAAAQSVDEQIDTIGEVTLDSESKIAEAESALAGLAEEDRIQNINFYSPKALKYYSNGSWAADVRCFILPYLGRNDSSVWLRLIYNYTGSDWVFFEKVIVVADGQKFEKSFDYSDIVRDNEAYSVWEYVDDTVSASDEKMLWAIANSKETLVRFQGDDYMHDFTVNATDKQAIREVMTAYDALK